MPFGPGSVRARSSPACARRARSPPRRSIVRWRASCGPSAILWHTSSRCSWCIPTSSWDTCCALRLPSPQSIRARCRFCAAPWSAFRQPVVEPTEQERAHLAAARAWLRWATGACRAVLYRDPAQVAAGPLGAAVGPVVSFLSRPQAGAARGHGAGVAIVDRRHARLRISARHDRVRMRGERR